MKTLYVVARYNEDISWIDQIDNGDFLIFNKGEEFETKYGYTRIPNVGREAETYLKAIVLNYNILSNYDNVIFLQGNPIEHCFDLIDYLNSDPNEFKDIWCPLSHNCPELTFHRTEMLFYFPTIYQKIFPKLGEGINFSADPIEEKYCRDLFDLLFMCGINLERFHYNWATGAQYSVPTSMILNKPHSWWCKIYFLFEIYEKYKDGENKFPYIIERGWPAIWSYIPCSSSKLSISSNNESSNSD